MPQIMIAYIDQRAVCSAGQRESHLPRLRPVPTDYG
jgi:hypothetical protein